jgi:hypothetical protein
MNRGNSLILAERAIELVPRANLRVLVGDLVRFDDLATVISAVVAGQSIAEIRVEKRSVLDLRSHSIK